MSDHVLKADDLATGHVSDAIADRIAALSDRLRDARSDMADRVKAMNHLDHPRDIDAEMERFMARSGVVIGDGDDVDDAPDDVRGGRKRTVMIPDAADPKTMLRLETAAAIAFPDGSMSVSAMRREAAAGRLTIYRIAGKDFTTMSDIEGLKAACRVLAKAPVCTSKSERAGKPSTSSETPEITSEARAALRASLQRPKVNSHATRSKNTIPRISAEVIPMKLR